MTHQSKKVATLFPGADSATAGALALAADPAIAQASGVPEEMPPAAVAQVQYWRRLCGAVSEMGASGMRDHEWPPELARQADHP